MTEPRDELPFPETDKGGRAEELLRAYFLQLGYFAVRGVKLKLDGLDVTDVDLWLYQRPSALFRERTNVDIKDKKSAAAMERLFWAKGLQTILGLDRCIVATSDKRPSVAAYGRQHGVVVLDGMFLGRLRGTTTNTGDRLTEEEFLADVLPEKGPQTTVDWRTRIVESKGHLLTDLSFDGCNAWLEDARQYCQDALVSSDRRQGDARLLYVTLAYLFVGLDFAVHKLVLDDSALVPKTIAVRIRYGDTEGNEINKALALVSAYVPDLRPRLGAVKRALDDSANKLPAEVIAEYVCKNDVQPNLLTIAKQFEAAAYSKSFVAPQALPTPAQSALGAVLDFHNIDRKRLYDNFA